jgi:hypothetical protein
MPKQGGSWVVDIKGISKKYFVRTQAEYSGYSCKHGYKPLDATEGGGFPKQLSK